LGDVLGSRGKSQICDGHADEGRDRKIAGYGLDGNELRLQAEDALASLSSVSKAIAHFGRAAI